MTKKHRRPGGPNGPMKSSGTQNAAKPSAREVRAARARSMRRRKRILNWSLMGLGGAVVVGVIALAASQGSTVAGSSTSSSAWVLPRLGQSGTVSLESLHGRPVVANFFASWCTACQEELPVFAGEARKLQGKVTFVEVNSLETGNGLAMASQFGLAASGAILASDVGGAQNSGLHD
ncbi:MAG: TlpA disulfide reductase family protein [Acidimicrobiales bacterium]